MRPKRSSPGESATGDSRPTVEAGDSVLDDLRSGKIAALEEIVTIYGARVFNVCLGILTNHADAEDACQEVFLRAFQQAAKYSGHSRFSTWLLRLATNLTLNRAKAANRRKRLSEPLLEDTASSMPAPEYSAINRERQEAVAQLLQRLPLEQRQVLILREMEGLSYAELAELLRVPVGTVTSRLIRGRAKLRALVKNSEIVGLDLDEIQGRGCLGVDELPENQ